MRSLILIFVGLLLSGCTLLIPEKPLPDTNDYAYASQACIQSFHPNNPLFGQCIESSVAAKSKEAMERERLKGIAIGIEAPFWIGVVIGLSTYNNSSSTIYYY